MKGYMELRPLGKMDHRCQGHEGLQGLCFGPRPVQASQRVSSYKPSASSAGAYRQGVRNIPDIPEVPAGYMELSAVSAFSPALSMPYFS
jgi:hypothetical protein